MPRKRIDDEGDNGRKSKSRARAIEEGAYDGNHFLIRTKPATRNLADPSWGLVLLDSIRYCRRSGVTDYLRIGVSPNLVGANGQTPLIAAVMYRRPEMIEELIAAGADPNQSVPNFEGDPATRTTALDQAVLRGRKAEAEVLLRLGANPALCPHLGQHVETAEMALDLLSAKLAREALKTNVGELGDLSRPARAASARTM